MKAKKETKADRLFAAAQEVLDAVEEARKKAEGLQDALVQAQDNLQGAINAIEEQLENLRAVREENYQEWFDNLPENLQASAVGEKLSALLEIDLEPSMPEIPELEEVNFDDVEQAAQEIMEADLPLGFGRD